MWLLLLVGCVPSPPADAAAVAAASAPVDPASAPARAAEVAAPDTSPPALRVLPPVPVSGRLLLDAGHGAPGNPGNTNAAGISEQDVMRGLADAVAGVLGADGVQVTRTRPDAALVDYDARLALAARHDWLVSLHSDARAGTAQGWVDPAAGTWWTAGAAGFAVLWSDEGPAALVEARHRLARAVARRLAEAGASPYPGTDYVGLYAPDEEVPGVFVDRHAPAKRIRLLRRPTVPSVIVETHDAHDLLEVETWGRAETATAFARALSAALADVEATGAAPVPTAR